jgi:hypothetical protein
MENASKALLMAAGVLIGMMVLSLMVYLFISFGSTSQEIREEQAQKQLNQFNTQFTSYVGKNNTIYDVVTAANLATKNNIYYELEHKGVATGKDNYISVYLENNNFQVKDRGWIERGYNDIRSKNYDDIIRAGLADLKAGGTLAEYTCEVKISTETQRVYWVKFVRK